MNSLGKTCITRGEILHIDYGKRLCTIDIPILRAPGTPKVTTNIEAAMCIVPGLFNNLIKGDKVFIAFDEDRWERPIVLGKLFTDAEEESKRARGKESISELDVKDKALLPESTTFVAKTFATNSSLSSCVTDCTITRFTERDNTKAPKAQTDLYKAITFSNFYNKLDTLLARIENYLNYSGLSSTIEEIQLYYNDWLTLYNQYRQEYQNLVKNASVTDRTNLISSLELLESNIITLLTYFSDVKTFLASILQSSDKKLGLFKYGYIKYQSQAEELETQIKALEADIESLKTDIILLLANWRN